MVETRRQKAAAAAANANPGDVDASDGTGARRITKPPSDDDRGHEGTSCGDANSSDNNNTAASETVPERGSKSNTEAGESAVADAASSSAGSSPSSASALGESRSSELRSYVIILILALITYVAYPGAAWGVEPTVHTVFYYGWISAMSTGFGVLPLCFVSDISEYWIGVSNAIAGGMMTAASYSLFVEGCTFYDRHDGSCLSAALRTGLGGVLGLLFILGTKSFLDRHEDVKLGSLSGADTQKILLIVFVMTLHSFSEGVGIGVSFGGEHGNGLGVFISASLAVHNIPEGLAVAIVLLPRRVSKATAAIWCVVTSLPQPLMAVPAFAFVHSFLPLLPVGLGFAGGAMVWVAFMELLLEAYEDTDAVTTGVTGAAAAAFMIAMQRKIEENA